MKKKGRKKNGAKRRKDGLRFEHRATRAISQLHPELDIKHNQKLDSEYGVRRQLDVVGRAAGTVVLAYEARDKGRKVDIPQVEAFAKKVDQLVEKPEKAGIISSSGFANSPVQWVQFYRGKERLQELWTLREATPQDWQGSIRELHIHGKMESIRPSSVRLVQPVGTAGAIAELEARRDTAFLFDSRGFVCGNILDDLNREMRDAQRTGNLVARTIRFPAHAHLRLGDQSIPVLGLELEFEQLVIDTESRVNYESRFPDVIENEVNKTKHLILDPEKLLRASRSGLDLELSFRDSSDTSHVSIEDLEIPTSIPGVPDELGASAACISLNLALAAGLAGEEPEAPASIRQLLDEATARLEGGDHAGAEALYREALKAGTSLVALCNLAHLAMDRRDLATATSLSFEAAQLFPLQPHGLTTLAAALIASDRLIEARQVLDRGRSLHGATRLFRDQEADLLMKEGRLQEASDIYYSLAQDHPSDPRPHANMAVCAARRGRIQEAAWDAKRAHQLAPDNQDMAEAAVFRLAKAGDLEGALQIVRQASLARPSLSRLAARIAIDLRDHKSALEFIQQVGEADRTVEDWAGIGQLLATQGDHEGAVEALRRATASGAANTACSRWLADELLLTGRPDEALPLVEHDTSDDGRALRTVAFAQGGRGPEAIKLLESAGSVGPRLAVVCMERLIPFGGRDVAESIGKWLMAQESNDPVVLERQAVMGLLRLARRHAEDDLVMVVRHVDRLAKSQAVPMTFFYTFLAVARQDEAEALRVVSPHSRELTSDQLAVLVEVAFESGMPALTSLLAETCLFAGTPPRISSIQGLVTKSLVSAFAVGDDAVVRRRSGSATSSDELGATVSAALAYIKGDLSESIRLLEQLLAAPRVLYPAVRLMGQALAESRDYMRLRAFCAEWAPPLEKLAVWASQRVPTGPLGEMKALAAGATFQDEREFVSAAQKGHLVMASRGTDWASALAVSMSECPDAAQVWIERLGYPKEFLRVIFSARGPD